MTSTMQKYLDVQKQKSEVTSRLLEIRALEETPALMVERTELEGQQAKIETEFRSALSAVQVEQTEGVTLDAASTELRALTERASLGDVFAAAVEKRSTSGATKELQDHHQIGPHAIPLDMLREEHRAITPAPTNVGVVEQEVIQPVFAFGDAAYLSVSQVQVPSGDAVFPVLTSRPAVGGPHTDSTGVSETTGAYSAVALPPSRLQASFSYRRTDAARFSGMSESLRSALSLGLSEALDAQVISAIVADVTRVDRGSVSSWAHYKSLVTSQVDGRFAPSEADVRALVGSGTFVHASKIYRSTDSAESAVDAMRNTSGGLRVSAHIAAPASNKQDVIIRRGSRRDGVVALWPSVSLILDEISGQKTGIIAITAVLLGAFKIVRAGGFARLQVAHA